MNPRTNGRVGYKPIEEQNDEPVIQPFLLAVMQGKVDWPSTDEKILVSADWLESMLQIVARQVKVDEEYYVSRYPDVAAAINMGKFKSASHHYETFGFIENRQPYVIAVDSDYYLSSNPDIKEGADGEQELSAQIHFEKFGWKEGRLPTRDFSLLSSRR